MTAARTKDNQESLRKTLGQMGLRTPQWSQHGQPMPENQASHSGS